MSQAQPEKNYHIISILEAQYFMTPQKQYCIRQGEQSACQSTFLELKLATGPLEPKPQALADPVGLNPICKYGI